MQPQKLIKGIFASPSYFGIFDTFEMFQFPIVISPFTDVLVKVMHGTPDVVIIVTQNNTATNYTYVFLLYLKQKFINYLD